MNSPQPNPNSKEKLTVTFKQSPVLLALGAVLAINLTLRLLQPLHPVAPERLPSPHTWTWWATQELVQTHPAPNMVLLGSSLLLNPIALADADATNKARDFVVNHRSPAFEQGFKKSLGLGQIRCFNFCLPGAMISDDYLILRTLFQGDRRPELVVLGLGPRDFMDNHMSSPAASDTFKYLSRFGQCDAPLLALYMTDVRQQADHWLGEALYLQGKRLQCQYAAQEFLKSQFAPLNARLFAPASLKQPMARGVGALHFSEVEKDGWVNFPHFPDYYIDNSQEYRVRYRTARPDLFQLESRFLDLLARHCQEQSITLVIVNMPLTQANLALMPPGLYNRYNLVLQNTAQKYGAKLVNGNQSLVFNHQDFTDTCHMDASGGMKLIQLIAGGLKSDSALLSRLEQPASQLAGKRAAPL